MLNRNLSRRDFLGTTTLGALAGAAALADPIRAAAQSVGIKPTDLPDLTITEVKVYVANLGSIHKFNSPESGEICSIVTACGIEGNYTIGNRVPGTGWLAYAKETCLGKNVIDLLPVLSARTAPRNRQSSPVNFVGGFGYPNGMTLGTANDVNYHAALIDVILWDILGKAVNRPIYRLLGGTRDKMLAYASSQHLPALEDFAPQALEAKANYFRAYKIHPGRGQHRVATPEPIPSYVGHIEEIRSVRKAMGDEFTLLFDPVQQYNVHEALAVGHVLEECGFVSFEDPIPSTDIEGLIYLRQKLTVPIEVGEFLYSVQAFAEYIRRGAMDIVRLIADNVGGITGSFRIGQLADAFGMPCTPHNWGNGYDLAVHMHVELALPNCYWFEMPYSPLQVDRPYLKHKFRLDKDGYVAAPTGPGLGMELDRDALDKIMLRIER